MNAMNRLKRKAKDNKRENRKPTAFELIYKQLTEKEIHDHTALSMNGQPQYDQNQKLSVVMSPDNYKKLTEFENKMIEKYF